VKLVLSAASWKVDARVHPDPRGLLWGCESFDDPGGWVEGLMHAVTRARRGASRLRARRAQSAAGHEAARALETIEVSKRTPRWWREPPARFI
jgi:hypothetical protein